MARCWCASQVPFNGCRSFRATLRAHCKFFVKLRGKRSWTPCARCFSRQRAGGDQCTLYHRPGARVPAAADAYVAADVVRSAAKQRIEDIRAFAAVGSRGGPHRLLIHDPNFGKKSPMDRLIAAAVLLAVAVAPTFACEWQNSASTDKQKRTSHRSRPITIQLRRRARQRAGSPRTRPSIAWRR